MLWLLRGETVEDEVGTRDSEEVTAVTRERRMWLGP